MCRIAAYRGAPAPLSSILSEPPHGLVDQSRNAREMHGSSIGGDGWGVGWFSPGSAAPGMYKSPMPLWSDLNEKSLPHGIRSTCFVGHARYASPGVETCLTNVPLYHLDNHLWTINGEVNPWPGAVTRALRERLDTDHEADIQGATDAEAIGALWRTHLRRANNHDAAEALRLTLQVVRNLMKEHNGHFSANVILAHADGFIAACFAEGTQPNSLYCLGGAQRSGAGMLVASEPFDDGAGWRRLRPGSLVVADERGLRVEDDWLK